MTSMFGSLLKLELTQLLLVWLLYTTQYVVDLTASHKQFLLTKIKFGYENDLDHHNTMLYRFISY